MKLSENLDLGELTRSEGAKRAGITNKPTTEHIENMKKLATNIFQPIREHFGVPIFISSGYRSKALNTKIGGSSTSQHSSGEAIDIDMDGSSSGVTNKEVFDFIRDNLEFDQLIWEFGSKNNPDWVHVSYESTGRQRKQVLRAVKTNCTTKYETY